MVADISDAARLADTTINVEVSPSYVRSNAKTSDRVATIGVDSFDVLSVVGVNTIRIEIP